MFDWSFYSQGTSDQRVASADDFIVAALAAFGDPDPTQGTISDRGARLAHLVGRTRCLLVLDGLEPLQYPPGPIFGGKFKDAGMEALLKGLVAQNAGLCVVTTREKVTDIQQHYGRSADDIALTALTDLTGAALLHHHGANRAGAHAIQPDDKELQAVSHEVRDHGLTLQLLGRYLQLAENGDIRKRDSVRLRDAEREYKNDDTRDYGHAFKAMEAYEKWFQREGDNGRRQLAILKLLGLFDRPASKSCLDALRQRPVIAGLTEPFFAVDEAAALFMKAEQIQAENQPQFPILLSPGGFRYCDLLLADVEREAAKSEAPTTADTLLAHCRTVFARGLKMFEWRNKDAPLHIVAFDYLTLGRVALYTGILESREQERQSGKKRSSSPRPGAYLHSLTTAAANLDLAVSHLHYGGQQDHLPLGLLSRAWLRSLTGPLTGPDSAQSDLDEAWEIAERGPMRLFMADIYLYRARLFIREPEYPWDKSQDGTARGPADDLAAAEELINRCGYHRRDEELADAKGALMRHVPPRPPAR